MSDRTEPKLIKEWYPYIELSFAALAGALWYLQPSLGPWPLLLIVAAWGARFALFGTLGPKTSIEIPLLIFLGTAAASVWSAYDQEIAFGKFWLIVASAALFYAFVRLLTSGREGAAEESVSLLMIFGVGVSIYFILTNDWSANPTKFEYIRRIGQSLQVAGLDLPGHRLHPNVAGGMMALTIPFGVIAYLLAKANRHRFRIAASVLAVIVIMIGLILSSSRSAWVSLVIAAAGAVLISGTGFLSRKTGIQRKWILIVLLILALVLLGFFLLMPTLRSALIEQLPVSASGATRATLIRDGLALANDYPFIGAGLAGYMMLYSTYSYMLHVGFEIHAHNILLNVTIQQGLFALGSLLWTWLAVGLAAWKSLIIKEAESSGEESGAIDERRWRLILFAGAASLIIILVHGLVDDALYGSRGVLILFVPVSFAVPFIISAPKLSVKRRRMRTLIFAGLILILAIFFWRPMLSLVYSNLAAVNQSKAELSLYSWPDWPIQDEVRKQVDLSKVAAGYEKALLINPQNSSAAGRLGQIELSLGEYEDALDHLKLAHSGTPWDNASRQLLGEAYLVNGFAEEGRALWKTVNNRQDQLEIREFWYNYIEDDLRAASIREGIP